MPQLEQITIHPQDLQKILEALESKQHSGPVIIKDTHHTFTIRDINHFFITEITKTNDNT